VTVVSWSHSCSLDYVYCGDDLVRLAMCFVPCHVRLLPLNSQKEFFGACRSPAVRDNLITGPSIRFVDQNTPRLNVIPRKYSKLDSGIVRVAIFPASFGASAKNGWVTHQHFLGVLNGASLRLGPTYLFTVYGKANYFDEVSGDQFRGLRFAGERHGIVCDELLSADAVICMGFNSVVFDSLYVRKPCVVISEKLYFNNYFKNWQGLWWMDEFTVGKLCGWVSDPIFHHFEYAEHDLRNLAVLPVRWNEL